MSAVPGRAGHPADIRGIGRWTHPLQLSTDPPSITGAFDQCSGLDPPTFGDPSGRFSPTGRTPESVANCSNQPAIEDAPVSRPTTRSRCGRSRTISRKPCNITIINVHNIENRTAFVVGVPARESSSAVSILSERFGACSAMRDRGYSRLLAIASLAESQSPIRHPFDRPLDH